MVQEDYDQGYTDGRRSRDAKVESTELLLAWARQDLAREREEYQRLRALWDNHWKSKAPSTDELPF